jgi:hypothetical protein
MISFIFLITSQYEDVACTDMHTYYIIYLSIHPYIHPWLCNPMLDLGRFFGFLKFYTVGRDRTAQKQNKRTQTSVPRVGFEPTIPVLQRARAVHASDGGRGHCDRQIRSYACCKYRQGWYRTLRLSIFCCLEVRASIFICVFMREWRQLEALKVETTLDEFDIILKSQT